jgi:hypothetical protein
MGGNLFFYDGDVSTKTARLTTIKCMLNSIISTKNGRFMTGDLKDFYLGTDLDDYEYARITIHLIPAHIIALYNLEDKIVHGHVYVEARKGMYGLPQAGRLANDRLTKFLEPRGYVPCTHTHGLWRNTKSDLMFTLVVDDFGIRYTQEADATRLMDTLKLRYKVSEDWMGSRYIGLTLKWDYIDLKTCHTHGLHPDTGPTFNMRRTISHHTWTAKTANAYKRSWARSCIMHVPLTAPCWYHWAPWPPSSPNQPRLPSKP